MPQPRKSIISLSDTPFYHCMSRCVRRAFLCGVDHYSGVSYEHRRDWLEEKLLQTTDAFAIKLCAYAVMSNHYHVVLNVRSDMAESWTNLEVVERWHRLFSGTPLSQQLLLSAPLSKSESELLSKDIAVTFEKPGVYVYQCTPHAMMAMVGVINVGQGAENLAAVKAAAAGKKESFVTNQDRLDNYLAQAQ